MLGGLRLAQVHALFSKQDFQSEGIHEVLCLHLYTCHTLNREPDVVPCTVPYLLFIHKNYLYNLSLCSIPKLK